MFPPPLRSKRNKYSSATITLIIELVGGCEQYKWKVPRPTPNNVIDVDYPMYLHQKVNIAFHSETS